jgi:hypothetical protein
MCLTLTNAATVLDHLDRVPPARGYTRTLHHIGHLSPGDLWRPIDREHPRTVTVIHRHGGDRITLTDQHGTTFAYPATSVIATVVPDPLPRNFSARAGHPSTRETAA